MNSKKAKKLRREAGFVPADKRPYDLYAAPGKKPFVGCPGGTARRVYQDSKRRDG